jgi:hypothetical protein
MLVFELKVFTSFKKKKEGKKSFLKKVNRQFLYSKFSSILLLSNISKREGKERTKE